MDRAVKVFFIAWGMACLASCSSCDRPAPRQPQAALPEPETDSFRIFLNSFPEVSYPLHVPSETVSTEVLMDVQGLGRYLMVDHLSSAFGLPSDVPLPADNARYSSYYASAQLYRSVKFHTVLLHKVYEGNYYYLLSYDTAGRYIDGTCVSFSEGDLHSGTVRQAVFYDNYFQVIQVDIDGKGRELDRQNGFFEIDSTGKVYRLRRETLYARGS